MPPAHTYDSEVPCEACGSAAGCHEWWTVAEPLDMGAPPPEPPPMTDEERQREEEWLFERDRFWDEQNDGGPIEMEEHCNGEDE